MSFFDDIGTHEPPADVGPEPQVRHHDWYGPPSGVVPATLPDRVVLFRTERALMMASHLNVFPAGLQLTIDLWAKESPKQDAGHWTHPWENRHPPRDVPEEDLLRLGVEFSDGSRWANTMGYPTWLGHDDEPPAPMLVPQGGGGGPGRWEMKHWLWPLPTPGDLTFHVSWPSFGIAETSSTLDADQIRAAAERAEVVWPQQGPE